MRSFRSLAAQTALRGLALAFVVAPAAARAEDVYWTNPLGGGWFDATNWDGGLVPTGTSFAYLGYDHGGTTFSNPSGQTVLLSGTSADAYGVASRMNLQLGDASSSGSLTLHGGGLTVESGAALRLLNGSVTFSGAGQSLSGHVVADGGYYTGGQLYANDGATLTATSLVEATNGSTINLYGQWSNRGDLHVYGGSNYAGGAIGATVDGVDAGRSAVAETGGNLSISVWKDFTNAGTIAAETNGYFSLSASSGGGDHDFSNTGMIRASGGGRFDLSALAGWSNTGQILIDGVATSGPYGASASYGSVSIAGTLAPDALGTIRATNGGLLYLTVGIDATANVLDAVRFGDAGATTLNGHLAGSVTNSDRLAAAGGTWDGVRADHGIVADGLTIRNGISLGDGALRLGSVIFDGDQTFDGKIIPRGSYSNYGAGSLAVADGTLTLSSSALISADYVQFGGPMGSVLNHGTIQAGVDAADVGYVFSGQSNDHFAAFTNAADGRILASGAAGLPQPGTVQLQADAFVNAGTIQATSGGTVSVGGTDNTGTFTNTGTMTADGTDPSGYYHSTISLRGPLRTNEWGSISATNGGQVRIDGQLDNTGRTLDALAFGGPSSLVLGNGTVTGGSIANSLQLAPNVSATLDGVSTDHGLTIGSGANGLSGSATIKNGIGLGDGVLTLDTYGYLTFQGDQSFGGKILAVSTSGGYNANGLTSWGGTLTLTNVAEVEARGANLTLNNGYGDSFDNAGLIHATQGGRIDTYYGGIASFTNEAAGRIVAEGGDAVSTASIFGADFSNAGQVQALGGGQVAISSSNFSNTGSIVADGLSNDGNTASRVTVYGADLSTGSIGDVRGTNGGKVTLAGSLDNTGQTLDASRFGAPGTLSLGLDSNQGSFGYAFLQMTGGAVTHSDGLDHVYAELNGVSFDHGLTLGFGDYASVRNGIDLGDGEITLRGGVLNLEDGTTFQGRIEAFSPQSIDRSRISTDSGGSIGSNGEVIVHAGGNPNDSIVEGAFTTAGTTTIESGANTSLVITQTGGHARIDGSVSSVEVQGGRLSGSGAVVGDLKNEALITPGNSVGTLTAYDFDQSSSGILEMEMASLSGFDVLNVTQDVSLDGTLKLDLLDPSLTTSGGLFKLLTYNGTLTGSFASLDAPAGWSIVYGNGFVGVQSQPVPEPASWGALGLGAWALLRRRRRA